MKSKLNPSPLKSFLNLFKGRHWTLPLFVMTMLTLGCQVAPRLSQTPNFDEGVGRFYLHQDNNHLEDTRIRIDGKVVGDPKRLDENGVVQKAGHHEVKFEGASTESGLDEIDYHIEKDKSLHLYYCENNGSFHWYMKPIGASFEGAKSLCKNH